MSDTSPVPVPEPVIVVPPPITIVTVIFTFEHIQKGYDRLLTVFEESIKQRMPNARLEVIRINPPKLVAQSTRHFAANTVKLTKWSEYIQSATGPVIVADCDMMLLQDISDGFKYIQDIGYTVRTGVRPKIPVNGGLLFVNPTKGARKFFQIWDNVNQAMFRDRAFHQPWREKYAGMNQAGFGYLLEHPVKGVHLQPLPCAVYNACSEDWSTVDSKTKLVHCKSELRLAVLGRGCRQPRWMPIVKQWQKYDIDAERRRKESQKR